MSDCYDNFECLFFFLNVVLREFVCFKKSNRELFDCPYVTIINAGSHAPQIVHASEPQWYASFPLPMTSSGFSGPTVFCAAQVCPLFISSASPSKGCCTNRQVASLAAGDVAHDG